MDTLDGFEDVWQNAVVGYEAETERKLEGDATFRKFRTLTDLDNYIEEHEKSFTTFREEHRKLYRGLNRCFTPLVPIFTILKGPLEQGPYAPAAIALGAASYLLQACEKVTKCYDAVEEVFDHIENITVRFKEYENSTMEMSLRSKMAQILAYILEIMGKVEKVVRRKRIKQWAKSIFLTDDDISPCIKKLHKFAEDELGLVVALTFARVGDVQDAVGELQEAQEEVRKGVSEVLTNQRNERLRAFNEAEEAKISAALKTEATHHISAKYNTNAEALTKGTGIWIKDDPMFQAWEEEKAPILWILGKPGVGKTMLATRTIEVLKTKFPQHPDIPSLTSVSYLYFKDDNPELQDCTKMWKAAASQIVNSNKRFKKHVLSVLKQDDAFASSRRAWELLFLNFFTEESSTQGETSLAFIIVDGLDEAPEGERVKFLACMAELTNRVTDRTRCRIQIAIFARPDVRADPGFDKIGWYRSGRIIITPERNSKDIGAFIKQNLGDILVLKLLRKRKAVKERESLAKHIYSVVQSRSGGMFLWASLVFHQIRDLPSAEAVKTSLAQAPDGLDDMLHHVFKRFDNEEQTRQSYLRDLLTWVLCTYRQLTISELFVLLHLTADQHCVSIKQDLLTRYSSIFTITGNSGEEIDDESSAGEETAMVQEDKDDDGDDDFDFVDDEDSEGGDIADDDTEGDTVEDDAAPGESETVFEAGNMIADSWHDSVVTFTHARIRDYLTTECDPATRRWDDCSLFNHDLNESKLRIVAACIRILATDIADKYNVGGLILYARYNWPKHLLDIDYGAIGGDLSTKLARTIASLFNDGEKFVSSSYGHVDNFTAIWFETPRYLQVVRRLISDHIEDLDEGHQDWARRVQKSTRALFEGMVSTCATRWLTKTGFDDPAYLDKSEFESWLLYAFNSLGDDGVDEKDPPVFYYGGSIPLEDIEKIADLIDLPKNEHWYTGVAWIMMEADETLHTQRAIEYFNKARSMAEGAWVALEGLAVCHGNMGLYREAVDFMNEAIQQLPKTDDYEGIDFHLRSKMGTWQRELGDPQEALRVTRQAYEGGLDFWYPSWTVADHHTRLSICNYIEALYNLHQYDNILKVVHELDAKKTGEEDRSMWIVFLRSQFDDIYDIDMHEKLETICRSLGRDLVVPLMRSSTERAVPLQRGAFSESGNLWVIVTCIRWLNDMSDEQKYVTELCEKVIEIIDAGDETVQQNSWWHRDTLADLLAMLYLKTAIVEKAEGRSPKSIIAQLDGLAYHQQGSKRYVRASFPALCMGEWLNRYEGAEKATWQAYIRPSVKQALYLLSDNDPWNDQSAYAKLGRALLCADDFDNARIALGVTMRPLEEALEEAAHAADGTQETSDDTTENTEDEIEDFEHVTLDDDADEDLANERNQGDEREDVPPGKPLEDKDTPPDAQTNHDSHTAEEHTSDPEKNTSTSEITENADTVEGPSKETPESDPPENIKYAGFEHMWHCDGCATSRNKFTQPYHELHFCRICIDVCFCETCMASLRADKLDYCKGCSSTHEHIQIFPVSDRARELTDALMEKRFSVQQEWLDGLKVTWGGGGEIDGVEDNKTA